MVSKHDKINNSLEEIVRKDGTIYGKNVEYGNSHKTIGEIDLLVYKNGILWLYEVKSNPNNPKLYQKAVAQMERARKKFVHRFEAMYGVKVNKLLTYYVTDKFGYRSHKVIQPVIKHLKTTNYKR